MTKIPYPQGKSFRAIWRCIYCGDDSSPETLTKEHIIPKALNGALTLPKSSCKKCASVTRDIEEFCLNNTFLDARTMLGLKTSRTVRPPLRIWNEDKNGKEIWREVGKDTFPLIFPAFDIERPGLLIGRDPDADPPMTMRLVTPPASMTRFAALNPKDGIRFKVDHDIYARMIAKIAHSFAVANYGLVGFKYFLPEYILGTKSNIFHYVGNSVINKQLSEDTLHAISISDERYIVVYISLFHYLGAPTYEVVVAERQPTM